jgi:hypothetical protein
MSCIWLEGAGGAWEARPLAGRVLTLEEQGAALVPLPRAAALLVRPGVRAWVNGEPVLGGLRLLEHKDEVRLGATRLFFSVEAAPAVAAFRPAPGERVPVCPVCRGPVREGAQAVQCPGCGRWFHQLNAAGDRPAKPCWTYAPACRFCNHPTAFAAEASWRPGREESLV